jgi:hypothetical protein
LDDSFTGLRQQLVLLAQPPVTIEPAQRALHDPAFGKQVKALVTVGTLDDFQTDFAPAPQLPYPGYQLTSVGLIGPDQSQPRKLVLEGREHDLGTIPVLHTGGGDDGGQDQPKGIDENMPFAPFDLFVGIKATDPPFSVVLTDWLSRIPALGCRRLPAATRTSPRSKSCIRCQVPSRRQRQKYW